MSAERYHFANILFAGPCNRACPWCIGERLPDRVNVDNLDVFPPRGIDAFVAAVNEHAIGEVVLTGTVTDPQLYRHEAALLRLLRARLHVGARLSVHTNGVLTLKKLQTFNAYDRACISFPSFVPSTYARMMGSPKVPDLATIVLRATIPVKVSAVVDAPNVVEIPTFLEECARIGVKRVVLRRLFEDPVRWPILDNLTASRAFRGNPVYDVHGMEVTVWDFDDAKLESLNLFADGTVGSSYLLTNTVELGLGRAKKEDRRKRDRDRAPPVR